MLAITDHEVHRSALGTVRALLAIVFHFPRDGPFSFLPVPLSPSVSEDIGNEGSRMSARSSLITLATRIHAPIERCFDLARGIDFHIVTAGTTREQAIAGRTSRLISPGDSFSSPLGPLGSAVDRIFLRGYMRRFLVKRARILKACAESEEWRKYVHS